MSLEMIEKGIDFAFSAGDEVRITFFGGEPLLEFDRIQHGAAYAKKKARETGKKLLRFSLTANGTLLDDEKLTYFKKENFFVAVSLDGIAEANNINRYYQDGRASYEDIVRGLSLVQQYYGKTATSSTVDPSNVKWLSQSFAHIIDLGVKRFSFNFNYDAPWDEASLDTYKEQMALATDHYINAFRKGNSINYTTFSAKINGHLNGRLRAKCLFGEGEVTLTPTGRLYPCERLVGEDAGGELCIGTIDKGIDLTKVLSFKKARLNKDVDCSICQVESRCIHFCGCVNWSTTGTIGNVSSLLCDVEQTTIQCADRAAAVLFEEKNPAFLKRFYGV
jgi:uncharacterized protein